MSYEKFAIGGYSLVSYFEHGVAEPGLPEFFVKYEGKTYLFTSLQQAEFFEKDPQKYLPAFGGTCAFGQVIDRNLPIDPTNFKIVDGQLLFFLKTPSIDSKALWDSLGDRICMLKAMKNWQAPVSYRTLCRPDSPCYHSHGKSRETIQPV